jgi:integrase
MSALSKELDRYLAIRRSLGYGLVSAEGILRRFIAFADREDAEYISTDLFLRWQTTFGRASRQTWSQRLGMIRLFAQWMHGLDPGHEVPPHGLIPRRLRRGRPYIYSAEEISRIVDAAAALPSVNGLRALTYSTLFGLIAATGLRISETLALDIDDVDLENGVLTIRRGKFGKARLLPLSESVTVRLSTFAKERDRLLGTRQRAFFLSKDRTRLKVGRTEYIFAYVCQNIGLRPVQKSDRHGRGPRIHDLRHTFAVRTLMDWYRTGKNPTQEMIKLTTYLGHGNPEHTYWYIQAIPELLDLACRRAETSLEQGVRS